MDGPVLGPGNGGSAATVDVAALVTALVLPVIGAFGPEDPSLAGLPAYIHHPAPVPEPPSRVFVARAVRDGALAALAAVKALEDRTAACKAALVARVLAANAVESTAFALDPWQRSMAETSATAEIATTLAIPQGTAGHLSAHATELLTTHPATFTALADGALSWRHACTIIDETRTLAGTASCVPADITGFEARLLALAPGTTAAGFAAKARRQREATHPESLATRVREAISKRHLALDPGQDGMAWLSLHIPATAAHGIYTHATRTARTQQKQPGEHRTLAQLRADTATALLLGQHPLPTPHTDSGDSSTTGGNRAGTGDGTGRTGGSGTGAGPGNNSGGGNNGTGSSTNSGGDAKTSPGGAGGGWTAPWHNANHKSGAGVDPKGGANGNGNVSAGPVRGGGGFDGLRLVDLVPEWAESPRRPAIGPLTEAADARTEARNRLPENIVLTGTLCPTTEATSPGGAGAGGTGTDPGATGGFNTSHGPSTDGGGGDAGGFDPVTGLVDGIPEDPLQEYLDQLEALRTGAVLTDPPEPQAQVIITVPVLGLLGATNEPAQLAGHGPIPAETARQLLRTAGAFLRVLTDPVTNTPLEGAPPERYRLRENEKTLLRALNETCSFPNCTHPALDTDTDHLTPHARGGPTTRANGGPHCRQHHALKHFRDDKDRHGRYRQDLDPERAGIKLRGWTPTTTPDGRIGWTSPAGTYHPPPPRNTNAPAYPKHLMKHLSKKLNKQPAATGATADLTTSTTTPSHDTLLPSLLEYLIEHHIK